MGTGNYTATSNNTKLVQSPLMGELSHLVQQGRASAGYCPAQSSGPNVKSHPSTAGVPITVLMSNVSLLYARGLFC